MKTIIKNKKEQATITNKMSMYSKGKCLPSLLWEQVQRTPNNIAVIHNDKSITYNELFKNSSELAIYLQYLGVVADDCVGLFVEPSIDLMIDAWGTLVAGGAYLPLAPEYPDERIQYMIEDSNPKIILTQEGLKSRLLALVSSNIHIITLDDMNKFKELNIDANHLELNVNLNANNLAYIIYTSGSSGKPKGVMIEHHSIVNQMCWLNKTFNLNSQSIILQKTPMSFDAAQWEILAPSCGSVVVMGNPGVYKNPDELIATLVKYNVNTLQCVPTLLQALLDSSDFHNCNKLTQIFSGGEVLSKRLALECMAVLPKCSLINLYGPTECTINTSAFIVDQNTVQDGPNNISIGYPIDNTEYYIFDDCLKPTPMGEIGELYIGGEGLARGYLQRPSLTADRFINNPFDSKHKVTRLYKSGDLAFMNSDGSVQCVGRADNQVKLRGFRIELDEIKLAIENHDWVKSAAVIVKDDQSTGYQNLIAYIELDSKEAALMDQGNHDAHHQSKESKTQVMMQLSNQGCRDKTYDYKKNVVDLPGKIPTKRQREQVFARKTYRFFEGGIIKKDDILQLLENQIDHSNFRNIEDISYAEFGEILRYFGQYVSKERLLPKYGYASPGALYATQMYLELNKVGGLKSGYYYYHPVYHQLILIKNKIKTADREIKVHFVGKKSAILPIYKNNIQEVLEIETGHMIGLFEKILPQYGLNIIDCKNEVGTKKYLEVAKDDFYLGAFQIVSGSQQQMDNLVDIYVGIHPGKIVDLKAGQYHYTEKKLVKVSDEIILKKHVIAINQEVYDRSSFGITVISKTDTDWMSYINLGRKLQRLQMNEINMGFMSSGYSSKTANDLPSAKKIQDILGKNIGPSYFFLGGSVSNEQIQSEGMKEDSVHMKGPAEMIRDTLINFLPDYMLPNKVVVLDKMPLTVNGKIDFKELKTRNVELVKRKYVAPRTEIEQKISNIWKYEIKFRQLKRQNSVLNSQKLGGVKTTVEEKISNIWQDEMKDENISINDNFFELGGNSLMAVSLINKINKELNTSLSLQVLFTAPTIEKLALKVSTTDIDTSSRLVALQEKGVNPPIYCWPGLGGYCMNLRQLAKKIGTEQPFYGIQACGINQNEVPYLTIKEMAEADIKMIRKLQPNGPYTLWGYSFGARVAFEAAYQLEKAGELVENLFLIAPGSPKLKGIKVSKNNTLAVYDNKAYVTILFSVFMGKITGETLAKCLEIVHDEDSFVKYITEKNSKLDVGLVRKIIKIVSLTYEFKYSFNELKKRQLSAPITIFKADGDDYSFIEKRKNFSLMLPKVVELKADHYSMLKEPHVLELVRKIKQLLLPKSHGRVENNKFVRKDFRGNAVKIIFDQNYV